MGENGTLFGSIRAYVADMGHPPGRLMDLLQQPGEDAAPCWRGPYAEEADLVDAYGTPYAYTLIEDESSPVQDSWLIRFESAGLDRQFGTEDDIARTIQLRQLPASKAPE